jgi:hypothetical protein
VIFELQVLDVGKKCSACKKHLPINHFHRLASAKDGLQLTCKKCTRERHVRTHTQRCVLNPKLEWAKQAVGSARYRSKNKSYGCTIDVAYAVSIAPDFCPVFGFPLKYSKGIGTNKKGGDFDSPSIDRINPNLGYTKGNVVVISRKANVTKNNCSIEEIRRVADWLEFITSVNKVDGYV